MPSLNKIVVVCLLFATFVLGALLSYMWIAGYYVSLGLNLPKEPILSISGIGLSPQRTASFNVTVLNPSLSSGDISIIGISILTPDGVTHALTDTIPTITSSGYAIPKGTNKTVNCFWDWENYRGQSFTILVFVKEGSGATVQKEFPFVNLTITDFEIDPVFADRFNMTVKNMDNSETHLNITAVRVLYENRSDLVSTISPELPQKLENDASVNLMCYWDWSLHQNQNVTIKIDTEQGYSFETIKRIPEYVTFSIDNVSFNSTDTTRFQFTASNAQNSAIALNITRITVTFGNNTFFNVTQSSPTLPYILSQGEEARFQCSWDWTDHHSMNATVTVYTSEGYEVSSTRETP